MCREREKRRGKGSERENAKRDTVREEELKGNENFSDDTDKLHIIIVVPVAMQ